ncbi:MAG: glycosyltransferase [Anaerolineae bacterium]|nr:glycosyltransferase [Anaerolineae bacterium]
MRIAFVTTYPPGKGTLNEYGFHFANHLRQKDEVSELYLLVDELPRGTTYPADEPAEDGRAALFYRPCWRFGSWRNAWRIQQAVANIKPDIVLFNLQFATFSERRVAAALGLLAPWLSRQNGTLSAVLLHNIMEKVDLHQAGFGGSALLESVTRLAGNFFTRMLLRADMVAVTIPRYVEILSEKYKADHVVLAPHGAFETIPQPSFNLPPGPLQIMTFGKFGTYKRVELLIQAYERLLQRVSHPLELVIAGSDSPNARGYLARVQAQYAHVEGIRYTGYVPEEDVPTLFQAAAVVVLPYTSTTGSSGVLHQAGSYGKAVVLPHLGDFTDLVLEEGYTGQFYMPDDPLSLADAIEKLLLDPGFREDCGRRNYLAAVGLPMSDVVDWYLLHFERLLNRSLAPDEVYQQAMVFK